MKDNNFWNKTPKKTKHVIPSERSDNEEIAIRPFPIRMSSFDGDSDISSVRSSFLSTPPPHIINRSKSTTFEIYDNPPPDLRSYEDLEH